jgi:hypothetical protein
MRRLAVLSVCLTALAAPAGALALHSAAGDGTLVVKNGSAPDGVAVVKLTVKSGSVIGQVANGGKIIIDAGLNNSGSVEVTGAGNAHDVQNPKGTTANWWASTDGFKFRAVNGHFSIVIYGSGVNVFAVGTGNVVLQGMPDVPKGDGRYSLEGADFVSMPGSPTQKLLFGDNGS